MSTGMHGRRIKNARVRFWRAWGVHFGGRCDDAVAGEGSGALVWRNPAGAHENAVTLRWNPVLVAELRAPQEEGGRLDGGSGRNLRELGYG